MRVEGHEGSFDYSPGRSNGKISDEAIVEEKASSKIAVEELKSQKLPGKQELENASKVVNEAMKISNRHLEFNLHEDSGRYHVKVVDNESGKVIREIPPENMLELSAKIKEMLDEMIGLLVDELV